MTLLSQITELIVRKEPTALPSFISDLAVLYTCEAPAVRRWLSQFLGEACQACPLLEVLWLAAGTLQLLAADTVPGVAKQACLSCVLLIRSTLGLLAIHPQAQELQRLYSESQAVALAASSAALGHRTEGARIAGVKLYESLLVIFASTTAPLISTGAPVPPFIAHLHVPALSRPNPAPSPNLADKCLDALIASFGHQQRRLAEGESNSQASKGSPLLIVLIKALANVTSQLPDVCLNRCLPCLLNLAQQGFRVSSCTESGGIKGGDLSVGNALRNALVSILRSKGNLGQRCKLMAIAIISIASPRISIQMVFNQSRYHLNPPFPLCSMREGTFQALSTLGANDLAERYRQRER